MNAADEKGFKAPESGRECIQSRTVKSKGTPGLAGLAAALILLLRAGSASAAGEGTVIAWGLDNEGQVAVPPGLHGVTAIAAGPYHNLALKRDGTVSAWGWNSHGQSIVPSNLTEVVSIAAGFYHSLALKNDGTVIAWGGNDFGQTTVPMDLREVVAIAAGNSRSLALRRDGTVIMWGENQTVPTNALGAIEIAAGYGHNLALKPDGTVVAWGWNASGQSRVPSGLTGVIAIAAGFEHSFALKGDGTAVAWGKSDFGQGNAPAGLANVIALAGGGSHSLALKENGTVVAWGYNNEGQVSVPSGLTGVSAISAGAFHSIALLDAAPLGAPAVLVNGAVATNDPYVHPRPLVFARGSATIQLSTSFTRGTILFTLDDSEPNFSSQYYDGPTVVRASCTLRSIAYNADFTQMAEAEPVDIFILPVLTATSEGGGSVVIDPPSGDYLSDGTAALSAVPAPGWRFLQWLGDATGTNLTTNIAMTRNRCVRAVFGTVLSTTVVGNGAIVRDPEAAAYPYGSRVTLTGVPQAGHHFALWGNAGTGTNNPLSLHLTNANPTVTAVFAALPGDQRTLTALAEGFGLVQRRPNANRFKVGAEATLLAISDPGQDFLGWSGDASGTNNPLQVTMDSSKVITAQFTKRPRLSIPDCPGANGTEDRPVWVSGEWGAEYLIERAPDLEGLWNSFLRVTNEFGIVQFLIRDTTNTARQFYRALKP